MNVDTEELLQKLLSDYLASSQKEIEKEVRDRKYQHYFREYQLALTNYHTWVNYYSLFNGALFVAFCTLLTNTGNVENLKHNVENLEHVDCSYWEFLAVITSLGILASFFWLLSFWGYESWINHWREALYRLGDECERVIFTTDQNLKFSEKRCNFQYLPKFYSTSKITSIFIYCVMLAWSSVFCYTIYKWIVVSTDMYWSSLLEYPITYIIFVDFLVVSVCVLMKICGRKWFMIDLSHFRIDYPMPACNVEEIPTKTLDKQQEIDTNEKINRNQNV